MLYVTGPSLSNFAFFLFEGWIGSSSSSGVERFCGALLSSASGADEEREEEADEVLAERGDEVDNVLAEREDEADGVLSEGDEEPSRVGVTQDEDADTAIRRAAIA